VIGVELERGREVAKPFLLIAELVPVQPPQTQVHVDGLVALDAGELAVELRRQLAVALRSLVQRLERLLHRIGPQCCRRQPLVLSNRPLGVVEPLLVDLGGTDEHLVAGGLVGGPLGPLLQQDRQRLVFLELQIDAVERLEGLRIIGRHLVDALVRRASLRQVAQPPERDLAHRLVDPLLQVRVEDVVDRAAVGPEQSLGALRLFTEPLDLLEDLGELGLVGGLGHRLAQHRERLVRIADPFLLGRGHTQQRLQSTSPRRLLARLQLLEPQKLGPVLLRLVDRHQDPHGPLVGVVVLESCGDHRPRPLVGGGQIQYPLEQLERVPVTQQSVTDDLRGVQLQLDAVLGGLGQRHQPPQVLLHVGPALEVLAEPDQRLQSVCGLFATDLEVDHRLERGDGTMRVAELVACNLADLAPHRCTAARIGGDLDAVGKHLAQPIPLALLEEQTLERFEGLQVVDLHVENLGVGHRRADAVAELLLDRRNLEPNRDLLRSAVGEAKQRALGLDQRHAVTRLEVQSAQGLDGLVRERGVGRIELEQLAVGRTRELLVTDRLVEQNGDAMGQIDLQRSIVGHHRRLQRRTPHRDQIAGPAQCQRQPLHLFAGVEAARVEQIGLAHRIEGACTVGELGLAQSGNRDQVRDRFVDRARLCRLAAPHLENPNPAVVVALRDVDRLEQRARL